jgi:hypothetical protein
LQETKRKDFTPSYVRKLAPKAFQQICFCRFPWSFWEIFVVWNSTSFSGTIIYSSDFALTIQFSSMLNA